MELRRQCLEDAKTSSLLPKVRNAFKNYFTLSKPEIKKIKLIKLRFYNAGISR